MARFLDGDDSLLPRAFSVKFYASLWLPDGTMHDRFGALIERINELCDTDFPVVPHARRFEVYEGMNSWWEETGRARFAPEEAEE